MRCARCRVGHAWTGGAGTWARKLAIHTRAVATTAARKAVTAARIEEGTPADGQQAAEQFLDQNGAALRARQVAVTRSDTTATATVSGDVASVLFGVPFSVSVTVDAPAERVTP